jgi:hypothetical protein
MSDSEKLDALYAASRNKLVWNLVWSVLGVVVGYALGILNPLASLFHH